MKIAKSLNRFVSLCVIALHVVVSTLLVVGPVSAQSGNADGTPLIELEVVESGIAGDSQVFSATITDNDEVLEVEFYYRFDSFAEFRQIPMTVIPGTAFYTATVDVFERLPAVRVEEMMLHFGGPQNRATLDENQLLLEAIAHVL